MRRLAPIIAAVLLFTVTAIAAVMVGMQDRATEKVTAQSLQTATGSSPTAASEGRGQTESAPAPVPKEGTLRTADLSVRRILLEMLPAGSYPNKAKLNTLFTSLDVEWPGEFVRDHKELLEELWYMPVVQNIVRNDQCIDEWLLGTWRTQNNSHYFILTQADSGGYTTSYNVPWVSKPAGTKYYEIRNLTYVHTDEDSNVLAEVYRFKLLEPDKIEVYAFKNQKTYTLVRK